MMNALTTACLIILPVTAACRGAPRCSQCQFAHSPSDRCCLECESRTSPSQEAAIHSYVSKQHLKTQQWRHRTPVLSLKQRFKSAFVLSSRTSGWIESTDLDLGGCKVVHVDPAVMEHLSLLSNLQVCLSASQEASHSFSPPLPRRAKAPHLLRLQRHLFLPPSHMTLLPRRSCLSL